MAMFSHAAMWIKRDYRDAAITFDVVTEEAEKLAKKFFPSAATVPVYEAEF